MSITKLVAGIALLSVAATAQAGWINVLPESTSVTLIFVALAVIAFAVRRTPVPPVESPSLPVAAKSDSQHGRRASDAFK